MPIISKPLAWTLGALLIGAIVYHFQDDSAPLKKQDSAPKVAIATSPVANDYKPEDFTAHFARLKGKTKNLFLQPQIGALPKITGFAPVVGNIVKVPATLADGDPNWIFTGIAVINDTKMALLENGSKHLAEYATEGQPWKGSKIRRISADGIALVPKDGGAEQVVLRYDASLEKAAPAGTLPPVPPNLGNQPVVPPMIGPIGNNLQIQPRRRSRMVISSPQPLGD